MLIDVEVKPQSQSHAGLSFELRMTRLPHTLGNEKRISDRTRALYGRKYVDTRSSHFMNYYYEYMLDNIEVLFARHEMRCAHRWMKVHHEAADDGAPSSTHSSRRNKMKRRVGLCQTRRTADVVMMVARHK